MLWTLLLHDLKLKISSASPFYFYTFSLSGHSPVITMYLIDVLRQLFIAQPNTIGIFHVVNICSFTTHLPTGRRLVKISSSEECHPLPFFVKKDNVVPSSTKLLLHDTKSINRFHLPNLLFSYTFFSNPSTKLLLHDTKSINRFHLPNLLFSYTLSSNPSTKLLLHDTKSINRFHLSNLLFFIHISPIHRPSSYCMIQNP